VVQGQQTVAEYAWSTAARSGRLIGIQQQSQTTRSKARCDITGARYDGYDIERMHISASSSIFRPTARTSAAVSAPYRLLTACVAATIYDQRLSSLASDVLPSSPRTTMARRAVGKLPGQHSHTCRIYDVITTCTGTAPSKTTDRFIDRRRGGRHKAALWKCRLHCMHRWHGHAVLAMSTTWCLQDAR